MYMESRKMVLMKLFAGQQWTHRHREQTYGQDSGEAGRKEREVGSFQRRDIEICMADSC